MYTLIITKKGTNCEAFLYPRVTVISQHAPIDTDARATRIACTAFVLRSAKRTLLYSNSQCKQVRQFGDDYSIGLVILE